MGAVLVVLGACHSTTSPATGTIQFVNHSSVTQLPYIYDSSKHTVTYGSSISDNLGSGNSACAPVAVGDQLIVAMSIGAKVVGPSGLVSVTTGSPHWTFTVPDTLTYSFAPGASC